MSFHELLTRLEDLLKRYDKGKKFKLKELEALEAELEEKRRKYLERIDQSPSQASREKTDLRLRVVDAQLEKIRELKS